MFHKAVVESSVAKLWEEWGGGSLPRELSIAEAEDLTRRLAKAVDEKGNLTRELSDEEHFLIRNERLMCKASFTYWAERYAVINTAGQGLKRMFPLLDSQKFILQRIGEKELEIHEGMVSDGILLNLLKGGRQIGGSTLAEAIGAYKFTQHTNLFGVVAADEPSTSAYIFDMFERFVENLPWWLKPLEVEHVKNSEILFGNDSHIWVGSGKSTRGTEGKRGQLGRGRTISFAHLSELSSWEAAEQIDDAFMWALPRFWRTFVLLESTAKGRHNWWHEHWEVSKTKGRFFNVFIPWYAEPSKYAIEPPAGWIPTPHTLQHAKRCEESSAKWMGRTIALSKDQLYWYESTRSYYEAKDQLQKFIEEVGAVDDDETFQHSGRSVFGNSLIQKLREKAKPLIAVLEVAPWAELKPGPIEVESGSVALELPPGIGLKPLPRSVWKTMKDLKGHLLMWEKRKREHRYILGVDVSDGVGKDRSVIEVLRMGTVDQPAEQVGQYVSDEIDPIAFAGVIDSVGRFYRDGEDCEALAAIETNNHGLATQAHLNQHLGYSNLFIWQRWDARDPRKRLSAAFGWYTTQRTRPIILTELRNGVTTFDPRTDDADYMINSLFTLDEMKDFQVPPGGAFYQAEAAAGAHDDTLFACAIAYHADITTRYGENEPLSEKRRRLSEEYARKEIIAKRVNSRVDFQNSDWTFDEMNSGEDQPPIWGAEALPSEEEKEWA